MRSFTPLRYPGGKAKLAWLLKEIINENRLGDGCYAEPYAGGAGVALDLLLTGYVKKIYLNDLNAGVYSFWRSVIHEPDELCRKISRSKISVPAWRRHKNVLANPDQHSSLDVGFSFLFLNRTNRSGIINAGMIGGADQTGNWKIDARFNKDSLIERILLIAEHAGNIFLSNDDAIKFLKRIDKKASEKSLIYLDPPYFVQGKRLYDNFYNPDDHRKIANLTSKLQSLWMVSYDNAPEIREMYSNFRQSTLALQYSAQTSYEGSEVLIFSKKLKLPQSIQANKIISA